MGLQSAMEMARFKYEIYLHNLFTGTQTRAVSHLIGGMAVSQISVIECFTTKQHTEIFTQKPKKQKISIQINNLLLRLSTLCSLPHMPRVLQYRYSAVSMKAPA